MNNSNFFKLIQNRIPSNTSKVFLEGLSFKTLHYADIEPLTAKIANLLLEIGLKPGSRVVAQIPKSPMAVMLYLACLRSGIIFIPLNPAYTTNEMDYFLGDSAPSLLVCAPDKFDDLIELIFKHGIPSVLNLDELGQGSLATNITGLSDQHEIVNSTPEDIAVIIYTSGTTGKPKGAMLSHGNLASNALSLYDLWGWQKDDVLIHALPIFHVHGLFVALHLALLGGSSIKFLAKFDARLIISLLPQSSVMMGVPTFYTRLLQEDALNESLCRNMRLFISGSAPLLEETYNLFHEKTRHTILERYGMSETGMLASNPLQGKRSAGTVGFPLPEVSIRIQNENNAEVKPGEIGILQVKGPNVFQGYWRKPALTQNEFSEGYFITGDLVQIDNEARLTIVGRNSDMIISGGFNIYPKELECILDKNEGVLESAVFGIPHNDFGEVPIAAIVPAPGIKPQADKLKRLLKSELAGYKVPKEIMVLSELPRNSMGKVQKNSLRTRYTEQGIGNI